MDRFLESDDEERLVPMNDGSTMRLSRDPDAPGGVRITAGGMDEPMDTQTFRADERPEDFPGDVPFIGGVSTVVTRLGEPSRLFAVVWMMVPDPGSRFEEMLRWHADAGWVEVEEPKDHADRLEEDIHQTIERGSDMFRSGRHVHLEKDGMKRGVSLMETPGGRGVINLFEKAVDDSDPD